jgi:hypothetical protein
MATALKLASGRQEPTLSYIDVVLANLATTVAKSLIEVPAGAVITKGGVVVSEVFNSTTSDVAEFGDAADPNRYLTTIDLQSLGVTALVPTGYVYTAPTKIDVVWTSGGGVPTTGKFRLWVLYYVTGREDFTQG